MNFYKPIQILINFIVDILSPEGQRIQKLLDIPDYKMKELLPKSPVNVEDIYVLFDFQNKIVKLIVKTIKFKNNLNLKRRIAKYFYEEMVDLYEDIELFEGMVPTIVPMPMSRDEKRNKGFNQCEEICREIEKIGNPNIRISYNLLNKIRETKRQSSLSRGERLLNVRNSMEATIPNNNKIKTVIVIDDVFTTLSSFREAERALKLAGVSRVIGLFIAH